MHHLKSGILKAFSLVVTLAARFFLGCLLVIMAAEGLSFVDGLSKYALLNNFVLVEKIIEKPATDFLHANVPSVFAGLDLAPYYIAVAFLVLWILCEAERYRLRHKAWLLKEDRKAALEEKAAAGEKKRQEAERKKRAAAQAEQNALQRLDLEAARASAEAAAAKAAAEAAVARANAEAAAAKAEAEAAVARANAEAAAARVAAEKAAAEKAAAEAAARAAAETAAAIRAATPPPAPAPSAPPVSLPTASGEGSQREQLLELYAQTKKSLEEQKKNLSFLAVDVVNSTGMKLGEDSSLAERDFRQYKKLVERVIAAHKGLKAAWTPDGVMICFASVQNAVQAAQDLIRGLDHFNKTVKTIKADFKVRCGINAGNVLFDESVRMEEMTDRNIDIAGHMQKYADANTIYVGAHAIEGIRAHGFTPAQKQVDGHDVYEWRADGLPETAQTQGEQK